MRGIEHFISTPRKINLLTNTLSVTYPAVQGEVNPVGFYRHRDPAHLLSRGL